MGKQEDLEKLNKEWMKKCPCKLKKQAIQAVPGAGSANAEIIFITIFYSYT